MKKSSLNKFFVRSRDLKARKHNRPRYTIGKAALLHLRYSFQSVSGAISDLNRDILLKPGFIPRARQAAVVSKKRTFYIPPALSGRRFIM